MKSVFILHDAFTQPTAYWYPSINSLLPKDYELVTPELSSGSMQGFEYWMKSIELYRSKINADTIFITHGISSLLLLRILETISTPVRSCIIVAGTAELPEHKVLAPIAETFLQTPFDWNVISRKTATIFHVWNASDPFIVPRLSKHFAELVPGKNYELSGAEHFQEILEPDLVEVIQTIFKKFEQQDIDQKIGQEIQKEADQKITLVQSMVPGVTTYDSDVAKSVAGYQGKVISELLSEAHQREKIAQIKKPTSIRNIMYIVATIILIIGSLGMIGYTWKSKIPVRVPIVVTQNKTTSNFLRLDTVQPLDISVQLFELKQGLKDLVTIPTAEKTFYGIIPTENSSQATLESFGKKLDIKFPLGFATKADDYVYGFYQDPDIGKVPFLLITFDGYDVLHSIMNNWEPTILGDMMPLFNSELLDNNLTRPEPAVFSDVIIKNIPMRQGVNVKGQQISYGFLSDKVLIITPQPIITEPIIRRLIGR
jgi:predicted alpha/beta hydrolase family esterase